MMQVMHVSRGLGSFSLGVSIGIGIVIFILLGMGAMRFFSDERLCFQRTVVSEDKDIATVRIHIDVNAFHPPASFMVRESLPLGWEFIDASAAPTTTEERTYSWLFWRGKGLLPIKDTTLSYRVVARSLDPLTGVLVVGSLEDDTDYQEFSIRRERTCV